MCVSNVAFSTLQAPEDLQTALERLRFELCLKNCSQFKNSAPSSLLTWFEKYRWRVDHGRATLFLREGRPCPWNSLNEHHSHQATNFQLHLRLNLIGRGNQKKKAKSITVCQGSPYQFLPPNFPACIVAQGPGHRSQQAFRTYWSTRGGEGAPSFGDTVRLFYLQGLLRGFKHAGIFMLGDYWGVTVFCMFVDVGFAWSHKVKARYIYVLIKIN